LSLSDDVIYDVTTTTTTVAPMAALFRTALDQDQTEDQDSTDVAFAGDIEKALQYSLTKEIPLNTILDSPKMYAIHLWINVAIRYLPLRLEVWQFLNAIRDWLFELGPVTLTGDEFATAVDKLADKHRPFDATPSDWQGCRGSKPHLRGYPCALWTTFHVISATAALNDTQNMFNSIAPAVVGYVGKIFSCTHCATNFLQKVETISRGALPNSPFHTMLWLWQIHNMANMKLKGDVTEDPAHPKDLWPSRRDCPECRPLDPWNVPAYRQHHLKSFQQQIWNMDETSKYLKRVYGEEVVPNGASGSLTSSATSLRNARRKQIFAVSDEAGTSRVGGHSNVRDMMHNTLGQLKQENTSVVLDFESLEVINEYCTKLYRLVPSENQDNS